MKKIIFIIVGIVGVAGAIRYALLASSPSADVTSAATLAAPSPRAGLFVTVGGPEFWPPKVGAAFPEMSLRNERGDRVTFKALLKASGASVILIEPIGLTCPGCAAFAGAHKKGKFRGVEPQPGIQSIEEYFIQSTGHSLGDEQVALVHLLLYSSDMKNPSLEDARAWADHFAPKSQHYFVIAAQTEYQNKNSYDMIPGFYLADGDLKLLKNSTGHEPQHSLFGDLLPKAAQMFRQHAAVAAAEAADPLESNSLSREMGLSVEAAYAAIPHKRTAFDVRAVTQMNESEKKFFDAYFKIVDNAVVARLSLLLKYDQGDTSMDGAAAYRKLLADAEKLPDAGLDKYKSDLLHVLSDHRDFFADWKDGRAVASRANLASAPKVQDSSGVLKKIYGDLMAAYPQESENNRDAFFQHLCALDFL